LVAGGCSDTCSETDIGLKTAELYNPQTNEWKKITDLPVPLHSAKMDLLADVPTLIGGYDGTNRRENPIIYQYDVFSNLWKTHGVNLRFGRKSPAVFQVPKSLLWFC